MQKLVAACSVAASVGLFLFVVWYAIVDIRYTLGGVVAKGAITSVSKEFAGFANDDVRGTEPTYRYRFTYSFDADGEPHSGESTTSNEFAAKAPSISVQYMRGRPENHRVLTPGSRWFRVGFYFVICSVGAVMLWVGVSKCIAAKQLHAKNGIDG